MTFDPGQAVRVEVDHAHASNDLYSLRTVRDFEQCSRRARAERTTRSLPLEGCLTDLLPSSEAIGPWGAVRRRA